MKKLFKFFAKIFAALVSVLSVLFAVYITNADSKLVEVIYDYLEKYHQQKPTEDKI